MEQLLTIKRKSIFSLLPHSACLCVCVCAFLRERCVNLPSPGRESHTRTAVLNSALAQGAESEALWLYS